MSPQRVIVARRLRPGTGMVTVQSFWIFSHGTATCTPFAGRMLGASTSFPAPFQSRSHEPTAMTTERPLTAISSPSTSAMTPVTLPPPRRTSVTFAPLSTTAPCSAAVRAIASVSRASSARASK